MGPVATWLPLRMVLRRTWRTTVVLGALAGCVGGIVAAVLATADRVDSSFERFLVDVDAPDVILEFADVEAVRADPGVSRIESYAVQFPVIRTADGTILGPFPEQECGTGSGELSLLAPTTPGPLPQHVVEGRAPAPGSTNEVVLAAITAERAGVRRGDTLFIVSGCHNDEAPLDVPLALTVVGISVSVYDIRPPGSQISFENVTADPALLARTGFAQQQLLAIHLQPGRSASDLGVADDSLVALDLHEHRTLVEERLQPDVTGLRLFALAFALAAVAVLGQLIARHLSSTVRAVSPLRAVGARRRDTAAIGGVHAAFVASVAGVVALPVTIVTRPRVPLGVAEEIERGLSQTASVWLVLGAVAITAAVVLAVATLPVVSEAFRARRRQPPGSPSWAARIAESVRLRPAAALGMRFALESERADRPVAIRSGVGAMFVATAAVAGVITFGAGLEHLRSTPRLVGWNWDFFGFPEGGDAEEISEFALSRDGVERAGAGVLFNPGLSFDKDLSLAPAVFAFDAGPSGVRPNVTHGRAPEGPDEVLLAPGLADRLAVGIGDVVTLYATPPLAELAQELELDPAQFGLQLDEIHQEVVGIGVLPVLDGQLNLGMAMTLDGIRSALASPTREQVMQVFSAADPELLAAGLFDIAEFGAVDGRELSDPENTIEMLTALPDEEFAKLMPTVEAQVVFVELEAGAPIVALMADLAEAGLVIEPSLGSRMVSGERLDPVALVKLDLDDVAWIPAWFGILMAATTLAVLAHIVATGTAARRRDLAISRALGLDGRGVRWAVTVQALSLVVVTMSVAIPVGVVIGRLAWSNYAEGLEVVPEAVTPWPAIAVLMTGLVVAALVVTIVPAWRAARSRPVEWLRSE